MFDDRLRRAKDRWGEPVMRRMAGVSPLALTLVAFALGLLAVALAALGQHLWALGFWSLNRLLDAFDGLLARMNNQQSDLGGYLDIVLDFAIYAALPIALVISAPTLWRYLTLALMLGAFYVNGASWMYLAAILEKRGAQQRHDVAAPPNLTTVVMPAGLVGAVETFLAYCAFLIWPSAMEWIFAGFAALVVVTTVQRVAWAIKVLR
jgi:phosphatidylglycerophosphate synthase